MPDLEIRLLDVGAIEYGDCVLCTAGGKSILIDGGKKKSSQQTEDRVNGQNVTHPPIQEQIESILGSTDVDLLVVTHCHSDHVGNLPALVTAGEINCEHALLADPQFGFGLAGDAAEPGSASDMSPAEKLWMAMREEPVHSADDAEVLQFIEDSAAEYEEYLSLVTTLQDRLGDRCVLYRGASEAESPGLDALLEEFQDTGLKIFGPTQAQLGNCALFLAGRSEDVVEIQDSLDRGGGVDLVAAYREAVRLDEAQDAEDAGSNGNAVNNQSIVLSVGAGPQRALLTGDMQFVKPQLSNDVVKAEMLALKDAISADVDANGPFGFVKLSHHGATNGQNQTLLKSWGAELFGISTGSGSNKHPTAATLTALKKLVIQMSGMKWARTDMNGIVRYTADGNQLGLFKQRGKLNDDTLPAGRSGDAGPEEEPIAARAAVSAAAAPQPAVRVESSSGGEVEVVVRLPYAKTRVTITVDLEPGAASGGQTGPL